MLTTLSLMFVLGANPTCSEAKQKLITLAQADACEAELKDGEDLDCADGASNLERIAELHRLCVKRKIYENDPRKTSSDANLLKLAAERTVLTGNVADLSAKRPSSLWYIPGALSFGASGALLFTTFVQSLGSRGSVVSTSGNGGYELFFHPLNAQTTATLVGGVVFLVAAVGITGYLKVVRRPHNLRIEAVEAEINRVDDLVKFWEEERSSGWKDFERYGDLRISPRAVTPLGAMPPLTVEVSLVQF